MEAKIIKYINKEISWLAFNARVLQEAENPSIPLIERIKFLGICSSNLDEFYRVRVATLRRLVPLGKKARKIVGGDPEKILKEINQITKAQHKKFDTIYRKITNELAREDIHILNEAQLSPAQHDFVLQYFRSTVRARLFPIMLDQIDDFPELRDRMIYLAVHLWRKDNLSKSKYALIEVPSDVLPRFLILPREGKRQSVILLDDVIRVGLSDIFAIFPQDSFKAFTIKITRDAELEINDDFSESYIEKVNKSLKQRKEGNPVRLIYDAQISPSLLELIKDRLKLSKNDTNIAGSRYHNNRDFMNFPVLGGRHLRYPEIKRLQLKEFNTRTSIFRVIRKKDVLLHFPYHSFEHVTDLLREASIDPKVNAIKLTVYRVARNSSILNALVNAARNGKKVVAVLELQARFDEEINIYWANRLQDEGIKVIFGIQGLKVHSKLCLITRYEKQKEVLYTLIGTGNFNEETARIYSDHTLFTADKRITQEVARIFEFLENTYKVSRFKHLLVSPNFMRPRLAKLIKQEIKNAKEGRQSYIILKVNNLVDKEIIDLLYEASSAGVMIKLIVRGMFSLVPGIPDTSDNIEAISIVDRFLEHSRIFIFCNDGQPRYYISSADLMPRNIDRRIEVTCPIYDPDIQKQLRDFIDLQWQDNVRARLINSRRDNRIRGAHSRVKKRAQWEIYEYLRRLNIKGSVSDAV